MEVHHDLDICACSATAEERTCYTLLFIEHTADQAASEVCTHMRSGAKTTHTCSALVQRLVLFLYLPLAVALQQHAHPQQLRTFGLQHCCLRSSFISLTALSCACSHAGWH